MNSKESLPGNESDTLSPASHAGKNNITVQRKLAIGAVNDPLEREADVMADTVMRMPEPSIIQRKCAQCEKEEKAQRKPLTSFIQKKKAEGGAVASDAVAGKIQSSKGGGASLPQATKSFMESRFGADFSNIKVHTDNTASELSNQLNAQAFTVSSDIYFNDGKYAPESTDGKRLLAHELTHTMQQNTGVIQRCINPKKNDPLYDGIIASIRALPAYTGLAAADKAVADGIITDAKKKAGCLYYAGKLKQLFETPEKTEATISTETKASTATASAKEQVRISKPAEAKNINIEETASAASQSGGRFTPVKGKFGGGTYLVDKTNPANIVVKAKVFLKVAGTGTAADVDSIKKMEDGIEKAASMKGFTVDIEFVNAPDADTFTAKVNPSRWEDATNWSGGDPVGFAHELLHMFAYELDRYNYIESHSTNKSMMIPSRLYWFAQQLTKPAGFDNDLSIMGYGQHPLDDDACRVAGLDIATCVSARRAAAKP